MWSLGPVELVARPRAGLANPVSSSVGVLGILEATKTDLTRIVKLENLCLEEGLIYLWPLVFK